MLPYFWYLLKVIICSGILFSYYWFFLRNRIFHQYNRFYLLTSIILSLLLPLLKINFWQPTVNTSQAVRVLQVVSVGDDYMTNVAKATQTSNWSFEQLYIIAYWLISIAISLITIRTLLLIRKLLKKYPLQQVEDVAFVNTEHESTPFSFLRYIFWNSNIDLNTTSGRQIFKHEVAHIQQKHTYDKLFISALLILCWCNPFFWLYRKELNMIHEFVADKKAVEDSDTSAFAAMILQAAYPKHRFELTNNFFYSPIKRRLAMLTKIDNPRLSYFVRVMVLPLLVLVFAAFTFKTKSNTSIYHGKKITVVIDAGHGGQDLGAKGPNNIFEKDLTLAIAKKVKELNVNNDVEIILSRDEDIYMTPVQKVEFAKSKNVDLFVSFHIDAEPATKAPKRSGISFWVANDEFLSAAKSKAFASAIINEFNNNYELPVIMSLNQGKQAVYVLQANTCPSVLIEAGFINNDKDIAYLQTNKAKETIAKNVLMAIEKFASTNVLVTPLQKQINSLPAVNFIKDTAPSRVITGVNPNAAEPLFIADGKETDKQIALAIKPDNIQDVRVIKDDIGLRVYGAKGKNGVVIINTKKNENVTLTAKEITLYADKATIKNNETDMSLVGNVNINGDLSDINIYVDGKKVAEKDFRAIDPKQIESININVDKGKYEKAIYVKLKQTNDRTISWGDYAGVGIELNYFKAQKELKLTAGYSLISATVWFTGPGFGNSVISVMLNSTSLASVEKYIDQCENGAKIVFDNVKLKDADGNIIALTNQPYFITYLLDEKGLIIPKKQAKYIDGSSSNLTQKTELNNN